MFARMVNRWKARQLDREIARAQRFLRSYDRAMKSVGLKRAERRRRMRELVDSL